MADGQNITHIAELTPDAANARRHNPRNIGMLAESLQEVGAARSIVIDEDGRILAGNGTVEAASQVGIERVRVIDADGEEIIAVRRTGLTEAQKTRLSLFDNRVAELATWHPDILQALQTEGVTEGLFTADEVAGLVEAEAEKEKQATKPEPPAHTQEASCPQCGCQFEIELVMGKGRQRK